MARVELIGLGKSFGAVAAVQPIDLAIEDGEFVVIVGPSGCGKSTLLRLVAGLEQPTAGRILIGGRDVTEAAPADRGLAMVFQSYALYPHLTVGENIAFPLRVANRPRGEIAARVRAAAGTLDLLDLLDRRPKALSGGQRQRVSIGRAIVREPQVLLLDEPLSNLDAELRVRMRQEFARLHQRLGTTMIYVTHDQQEAMTLANRIVVMERGRVEQADAPLALYERPATLAVATAIGSPAINRFAAEVASVDAMGVTVRLSDGMHIAVTADVGATAAGAVVTLGIRPEHLVIDEAGPLAGRVELFERLGPLSFAHLAANGALAGFVAQLPGDRHVVLGDTLRFAVAPGKALLFDGEGRAFIALPPSREKKKEAPTP